MTFVELHLEKKKKKPDTLLSIKKFLIFTRKEKTKVQVLSFIRKSLSFGLSIQDRSLPPKRFKKIDSSCSDFLSISQERYFCLFDKEKGYY